MQETDILPKYITLGNMKFERGVQLSEDSSSPFLPLSITTEYSAVSSGDAVTLNIMGIGNTFVEAHRDSIVQLERLGGKEATEEHSSEN